jgi:hypothetical protein
MTSMTLMIERKVNRRRAVESDERINLNARRSDRKIGVPKKAMKNAQ